VCVCLCVCSIAIGMKFGRRESRLRVFGGARVPKTGAGGGPASSAVRRAALRQRACAAPGRVCVARRASAARILPHAQAARRNDTGGWLAADDDCTQKTFATAARLAQCGACRRHPSPSSCAGIEILPPRCPFIRMGEILPSSVAPWRWRPACSGSPCLHDRRRRLAQAAGAAVLLLRATVRMAQEQ
jgi:hypothetical protein